ncbi:MAG: hypothetical protein WCK77_05660 [Verrucomicrobiota bacterium]
MHTLTLLAPALAMTLGSLFNSLANFVGSVVILASLVWSGFCLLSYLVRRSAPATLPAAIPAAVPAAVAASQAPHPTPQAVASAVAEPGIPAHIVAVIASAVYSMLDEKTRIISIKPQDSSWEMAGRQAILTSHRIR